MQRDHARDNPADLGPVERGPVPRAHCGARWVRVEQVDLGTLPPVRSWDCLRSPGPIVVDGRLDEAAWACAAWSEPFGMIHDGSPTPLETRCAML